MSAQEIYNQFEGNSKDYDFVVINFANGDLVGHTGKMDAIIKSMHKLSEII
jgi:2,3-bisphosphoglycerate-independent phosphoglycerate mutase